MSVYLGMRGRKGVIVTKDGAAFSARRSQQVWNHSPDGFEWGYGGSGPAQLALALLLDVTGDDELAVHFHQQFNEDVIAGLDRLQWAMPATQILDWLEEAKRPYGESVIRDQ